MSMYQIKKWRVPLLLGVGALTVLVGGLLGVGVVGRVQDGMDRAH